MPALALNDLFESVKHVFAMAPGKSAGWSDPYGAVMRVSDVARYVTEDQARDDRETAIASTPERVVNSRGETVVRYPDGSIGGEPLENVANPTVFERFERWAASALPRGSIIILGALLILAALWLMAHGRNADTAPRIKIVMPSPNANPPAAYSAA